MQPVFVGLIALLVSLYIVSVPSSSASVPSSASARPDARTLAALVAVIFAVAAFYLKTSLQMLFIYVALAIVSTLVVVYWARQGLVHFKEAYSPDYPVPLWLPVFFAQGFFAVHLFYTFLVSYRYLEEED